MRRTWLLGLVLLLGGCAGPATPSPAGSLPPGTSVAGTPAAGTSVRSGPRSTVWARGGNALARLGATNRLAASTAAPHAIRTNTNQKAGCSVTEPPKAPMAPVSAH